MARYPFEEFTRVIWIDGDDGITDAAAPTTGEIDGGVDITCFLTKDGLNPGGSTNFVEAGTLCNRLDAKTVGSVGQDMTLKGYRDNETDGDTFWDLAIWGTAGWLVVRRGVPFDDAFAAGQEVETRHAQMGEPVMGASAANTAQTFDLAMGIQEFNQKAVVAAGS